MNSNSGYAAKYGGSIRRLAALDLAARGDPNLTGAGPQPVTGAFDVAPQYQQRDPAREPLNQEGAFPEAAPAPGAMPAGQGPQAQGGMSAPAPGPFGPDANPQKIWDEMPADARKRTVRQVEAKGIDINKLYDEKVAAGEITPPDRVLSKGERLSTLAETMLRFAQNMGSGMNGGAAAAGAILDTQGRRGGLEQQAATEEAAIKEKLRQEGRSDTKDATTRTETVEDEREKRRLDREDEVTKDTREDQNKRDEEKFQAGESAKERAAEREKDKRANGEELTDADGNKWLYDKETGKAKPITAEVEETVPGRRGRGRTDEKKKTEKQLKGRDDSSAATALETARANRMAEFDRDLMSDKYKNEIKIQMKATGLTRGQVIERMRQQMRDNVGSGTTGNSGDDPADIL